MLNIFSNNRGGATLEYTLFLCATAILLVVAIASFGAQYRPDVVAWHQGNESVEIDSIAVGSIRTEKIKDGKNYRVITMPANLKTGGKIK